MKTQICSKCLATKSYIRRGLCKGCFYKQNPDKYKEHKLRGHTVVVWLAGGADWAEEVVVK